MIAPSTDYKLSDPTEKLLLKVPLEKYAPLKRKRVRATKSGIARLLKSATISVTALIAKEAS